MKISATRQVVHDSIKLQKVTVWQLITKYLLWITTWGEILGQLSLGPTNGTFLFIHLASSCR